MAIDLINTGVQPGLVSAELARRGVLVKNAYPTKEVSDAFKGTQYANLKAFLFSLEAQAAKTTILVQGNYSWLGPVLNRG